MTINNIKYFDEHGNEVMSIGNDVDFCNSSVNKMTVVAPLVIYPNVKIDAEFIDKYTFINTNSSIRYVKRIGRYCSIASNIEIGCPIHPTDSLSSSNYYYSPIWNNLDARKNNYHFSTPFNDIFHTKNQKITIGNDVWIGAGAKIMRSISIGDGAVIGAGAVVTKDVEPYTIVGGVPAKVIRKRFPDDIIERLLKIRWWDYSPELVCGVDISNVTHELLDELELRIESGVEKDEGDVCFEFDPVNFVVERRANGSSIVFYDNNIHPIVEGGISGKPIYNMFTRDFSVRGWYLPAGVFYNIVQVYVNDRFIGNAELNKIRKDVYNHFQNYRDSRSGWEFKKCLDVRPDKVGIKVFKNKTLLRENNSIPEIITPLSVVSEKSIETSRNDLLFPFNSKIAIVCDEEFKSELTSIFETKYTITDVENTDSVVIATLNWMKDISDPRYYGKRIMPFWFYSVFNGKMLDYQKLKQTSEYIGSTISELLGYIKKYFNRKILTSYGNCQTMPINSMCCTSNQIVSQYILLSILPVQDIRGSELVNGFSKDFLSQIDYLIYQNVSSENKFSPKLASSELISGLRPDAKRVCIPNVYFKGYYPQVTHNARNPQFKDPKLQNGAFPYGDENIIKMVDNMSPDEIVAELSRIDFYSKEFAVETAKDSLNELREREEKCDVMISDVIEKNYQTQLLFYTQNHPNSFLVETLLKRIFAYTNDNFDDFVPSNAYELKSRQLPIYPSVKNALALSFDHDKFYWWTSLNENPVTFEQYVKDYIWYCYTNYGNQL